PLSESEHRLLKKYGKLPRAGSLTRKSKERTYFDSGDFALSAANHETDNGAIQTGRAHPHRESISHPYASIPASSNVDESANEDRFRISASIAESPLLHQTDVKDEPTNNKEQDDHISHER
ncbi:Endosulphine, partial [Penicillium capsulatum]